MLNDLGSIAPGCSAQRIQDDLDSLSSYRDPRAAGWTRLAFSQEGVEGRDWVMQQMREAGLSVSRDAANNLIGILPGSGSRKQAIATGSHTDTVNGGGRFDGIIGVLAGLEVVRSLRDAGINLQHDLRVIDFFNEEPNPYGLSCVGSRALAGTLTREQLELRSFDGQSLAEGLESVGGDPEGVLACKWDTDEIFAFLELHIEQGPVLEQSNLPLAVVTSIAGIYRAVVEFTGQADHAGATPMGSRKDALCAAAEGILEVERIASGGVEVGVGTVGRIESQPGATNVVPASSKFWMEVRGGTQAWLQSCQVELEAAFQRIALRRGIEVSCSWLSTVAPVETSDWVQTSIGTAIEKLGYEYTHMFSGAGHDASHMSRLAPIGMIFVPSRSGRSHTPEEWTDPDEIARGTQVLLHTIIDIDAGESDDSN